MTAHLSAVTRSSSSSKVVPRWYSTTFSRALCLILHLLFKHLRSYRKQQLPKVPSGWRLLECNSSLCRRPVHNLFSGAMWVMKWYVNRIFSVYRYRLFIFSVFSVPQQRSSKIFLLHNRSFHSHYIYTPLCWAIGTEFLKGENPAESLQNIPTLLPSCKLKSKG